MYDNLKNEIHKEFDKNKNYDAIMTKSISSMDNPRVKMALGAICIAFVAIIGLNVMQNINYQMNSGTLDNSHSQQWEIKEIYYDSSKLHSSSEIVSVPHWEDMTVSQQFSLVNYNGEIYDSKNADITNDNIDKKIGTAILTGTDSYTKEVHSINADIYSIKKISSKCAIALQFEGTSAYYVYVNAYYKPETLGDLIDDLNLTENLSFGTVTYEYLDSSKPENEQFSKVEFYDVKDTDIWKMLFSDLSLENIYTDNGRYTSDYFVKGIGISVNIPLLGYKNISVSLTDKGYLLTNILDTGKGFYIGEEKVQEFIDFLTKNYKGYQIVYVDTNPNKNASEVNPEDDKIMSYDNTTNTVTEVDMNNIKDNAGLNYTEPFDPTKK